MLELERVFAARPYPDISTREHLAQVTDLPEAKIQVSHDNQLLGLTHSLFSLAVLSSGCFLSQDISLHLPYQVWFQNCRTKRTNNRKLGALSLRLELPPNSCSLPDTP